MKGDYSRQTLAREAQFSTLYMQQGRVHTDYDWNAAQAIAEHRTEMETIDVIGQSGVPNGQISSFAVTPQATGKLKFGAGRYYIDGLLVENPADCLVDDRANLNGIALPPPTGSGLYLAFLKVWQRHITAIEDPSILEVALGGPDTATRVQNVWQVQLFKLGNQDSNADCSTTSTKSWSDAMAASTGKLIAQVKAAGASTDPCDLPPGAGYRGLENQLYRVEIHHGGTLQAGGANPPTFKWSRENGSVVTSILSVNGKELGVVDIGKDDVLGFANGQWAEVVDDDLELADKPGYLLTIDLPDATARTIALTANIPGPINTTSGHARLRRWEQSGPTATADGIVMTTSPFDFENGIQVQFAAGTYQTGDYWLIPARTAINSETGNIEWPQDSSGNPSSVAPMGIQRHYVRLALINFDGTNFTALAGGDCRQHFPPLTDITASDVFFDDTTCNIPGVKTVQQAIDALCGKENDCCAQCIKPGAHWVEEFRLLSKPQVINICFQPGVYETSEPIVLDKKTSVMITGAGQGTKIVSTKAEIAFAFVGCESVTVRDLAARATVADFREQAKHLNGVLTFHDCTRVDVEHVSLECASGSRRAAACLTVMGTQAALAAEAKKSAQRFTDVRILHCDLVAGNEQLGVLLVDVERAQVEDNTVQTPAVVLDVSQMVQDKVYRTAIRRRLISGAFLGTPRVPPQKGSAAPAPAKSSRRKAKSAAPPAASATKTTRSKTSAAGGAGNIENAVPIKLPILKPANTALTVGNFHLAFNAAPALAKAWDAAFIQNPLQNPTSAKDLLTHAKSIADSVLLDAKTREMLPDFRRWYDRLAKELTAVGSEGIVVGGRSAKDIRILNNSIQNVRQGIHVGLSHRDKPEDPPDIAQTVTISGNRLEITLSPAVLGKCNGVFVGNVDSLIVENNYVTARKLWGTDKQIILEGVRVYGSFGRLMIVRQNHLVGVTIGVNATITPLPTTKQNSLWRVISNMMPGCPQPVSLSPDILASENLS